MPQAKTKSAIKPSKFEAQLLKLKINGWSASIDPMGGQIFWQHKTHPAVLCATPDWDQKGLTPFAWSFECGAYLDLGSVRNANYIKKLREILNGPIPSGYNGRALGK